MKLCVVSNFALKMRRDETQKIQHVKAALVMIIKLKECKYSFDGIHILLTQAEYS